MGEAFVDEEGTTDSTPIKYLPINRVYSSTVPFNNPAGSETSKIRKLLIPKEEQRSEDDPKPIIVYSRRRKKEAVAAEDGAPNERKKVKYELDEAAAGSGAHRTRLRTSFELRKSWDVGSSRRGRQPRDSSAFGKTKKWAELDFRGADPNSFVGLECKVFWPMDDEWYKGSVTGYSSATGQHHIEYADGDVEKLILRDEKIKFHISSKDIQRLNLKFGEEKKGLNYNEMLALAAGFNDCQELEPGEIVWAKITGHAMWPAVIVDESNIGAKTGLQSIQRDKSILVQFFGTHDFARIKLKQAIPFVNGLISSLHLKCKKPSFLQSLDEAKGYLSNQKLPKNMLKQRKSKGADDSGGSSGQEEEKDNSCEEISEEMMQKTVEYSSSSPLEIGKLRVTNLGKIVCDSMHFHSKKHIWPLGYTAYRMFTSVKDPTLETSYKMEVRRNHRVKKRPLFRITSDDGEQIEGPNPSSCWKEIYDRIRKNHSNDFNAVAEGHDIHKSGSYMFGFSIRKVSHVIQDLPNSKFCSKYFGNGRDGHENYKAVRVEWKDLDRCSVCHMDEEYEDNLFLQCDKCRMMVHAKCYGELEPSDGVLWFCNLCRPGAPKSPPPCCLCPVIGGAIKPTTDGRWAHLACAIWIPETCLLDVKKMEPIDGLRRINKDRWKLLCSICGVAYGACIQCSNSTCRVAYHPLCARAAGLCVEELVDEDGMHLTSLDEDGDQCIRLLSFCKKHRQPDNEFLPSNESIILPDQCESSCLPESNSSGCARTEPYNFFGRRGQKEPQILAAASVKRLFIENRPYLVGGPRHDGNPSGSCCSESVQTNSASDVAKLINQHETFANISSMAEKYENMRATFRKRLAFGKSRIHGFGVFAKKPHKAGDMVIEYIGEVVRPPIADIREHHIYNSLVGAGTYMFRIDNERVIDATRAGSIAHLINHSCEPNCHSRVISVNGDDHIIIFAKRDINQWEELTYDYRFFSKDKQLACFCGFPRCRKVVNDVESKEQMAEILVPRSDLIPWTGK